MDIVKEIIKKAKERKIKRKEELDQIKRELAKKYKGKFLSNFLILKRYQELLEKGEIEKIPFLEEILKKRPIRSLSGIVTVSVLTKPYPCPGKCLYCPFQKGMPKSYLKKEPAAERAKNLKFNPYLQVQKRLEMLKTEGHPTDKIELRIIGGTWSYYPKKYQIWFIKECFRAANEFEKTKNPKFETLNPKKNLNSHLLTLKKEQKKNEKAKNRIVGISIETRPDFIDKKEILRLRLLGVTMVELGVQSIDEKILEINQRGHGVKEIILATKLLKDAGFKVLYQMMLNLPGSNLEKDVKMFEELFENQDFKPDYLKIYPCALLKEAPLYKLYLKGEYKPYSKEELIDALKKIKTKIPYYVRIQRITRDIPANYIVEGGTKISNIREIVQKEMKKEGLFCKCIRCREVKENFNLKEKVYLFREDYQSSGGKEIFLSFETKDRKKLFSFLRLRIPNQNDIFIEVLKNSAIIREIKTFGELVPIGKKEIAPQHRGFGKKLLKKAQEIAKKEFGLGKITVISGVGVRDYFRKLGYSLKDTYMVKKLF
jgi:elongator complex protein 3